LATDKELFLTVTDVDECAEQNGECPQNCTNNVGNHTCSCFSGYTDVYDNGTFCTGTLVNIHVTTWIVLAFQIYNELFTQLRFSLKSFYI